MKILVFGAGAVGSTVGGMLAKAGHSVSLVGRNPHMSRIAASGLKIGGLWGDHHVTTNLQAATELPDGPFDWILVTTKAFDTARAAKALAQRFPLTIPVLHLQNGIGNADLLATELGEARVISGMIIIGFQIAMAGRTLVTVSADKIKIGRKDGKVDSVVEMLAKTFNDAHMPTEAVADIQKQLWGKALYSGSLNALAGILGVKYGELLESHPWAIIQKLIGEAYAVLSAEKQPLLWPTPESYLNHLRTVQVPATFDHKPSMLADLQHGRRTEVDFINGALSALGLKHRIATPVNDTIISLVHALEANGQKGLLHPSLQQPDSLTP